VLCECMRVFGQRLVSVAVETDPSSGLSAGRGGQSILPGKSRVRGRPNLSAGMREASATSSKFIPYRATPMAQDTFSSQSLKCDSPVQGESKSAY
jgi:hypothetical protein